MKSGKLIFLSSVVIASMLISSGCTKKGGGDTSSLYVPTSADVTATATLQELQQGRALFIDNCGSCHGYYNPDGFSSSQWKSIMNSMGPKAGLTSSETSLVTKYVTRGN